MATEFTPRMDNYREIIAEIFQTAAFIQDIGGELVDCGPGWCESRIPLEPRHYQQNNILHAGVAATLADHTSGASAATLMKPGKAVLTLEFKLNLLRPGVGEMLHCRAEVLKLGKQITVSEATLHVTRGSARSLVAKASVTLAYVSV